MKKRNTRTQSGIKEEIVTACIVRRSDCSRVGGVRGGGGGMGRSRNKLKAQAPPGPHANDEQPARLRGCASFNAHQFGRE